MRVALVCPYDLTVHGGVQQQTIGLARALAAGGDEVLVVAPGSPGGRVPETGWTTVAVGASRGVAANGSIAPITLSPVALRRALSAIRSFGTEVVHIQEPFAPLLALGATVARVAPGVGTFHRSGAGPGYRAVGPLLARVAARLDVLVAVSSEARATLASVIGPRGEKALIAANGIDVVATGNGGARRHDDGGAQVVFVGRHEERKGLSDLLEAFTTSTLDARLTVIGDGPQRAALEARHGKDRRVSFVGALEDAARDAALRGATLVVAPARGGESFGIVLLEAMAAGAPVLATDLPGYRAAAGDAARFVPPGDVAALRAALVALLADAPARRVLAAAGTARAARFSITALADTYRGLYATAVSSRRRAQDS